MGIKPVSWYSNANNKIHLKTGLREPSEENLRNRIQQKQEFCNSISDSDLKKPIEFYMQLLMN